MTGKPFDPDNYRKQTINRLIIGGIALLFIIGVGLIFYFYGPGAAGLGTICLIGGMLPLLLIIIILAVIEYVVKVNRGE